MDNETLLRDAHGVIDTATSIEDALVSLRDLFELKHIVYHAARVGARSVDDPYIRLTYPADWIKRYLIRGYINVDPVIREGFERALPFDWSELTVSGNEEELAFFADALAHDVGPNGLSIPLITKEGHRALFSVSRNGNRMEWERYKSKHLVELIDVAHRIHRRAIEDVFETKMNGFRLSPREIECLNWVSRGKSATEIADIAGVSEHTVRQYLKSARHKLNATKIAQAVQKATQLGIIRS